MGRRVKVREYGKTIKFHSFKDLVFPDLQKVYVQKLAQEQQQQLDRMAWDVFKRVKKTEETKWVLVGDAQCIRETALALCVRVPRTMDPKADPLHRLKTEIWVPKSQLHPTENEIGGTGHSGFLVIPEWLAKEKGLL